MAYIPKQGDIVWLNFDPSSGNEITKRRPAFVISREVFNRHMGLAIVAPITSTIRGIQLEVVLPNELKTVGAILVYQMRSLDIIARNVKLIEKTPKDIIEKVCSLARILVL
ncbi:MAG: PemK family transcriptional regulator [Coxiella sp. RIFCSPHIGHO2_12_FULL_44_14]|nr:MAG: PemK family transcriptional regulator [Coxiella sp. RIFCSPHIGHO2_12_FULL_44_14]